MTAQQFWAQLFLGLVFFVIAGFLWFFVVRPILEDWGVLAPRAVKDYAPRAAHDYVTMDVEAVLSRPVVSQTDSQPAQTDSAPPKHSREQLLTHYRWLRGLGASREDARKHLRDMDIPLDNNLWADAAPADATILTPYAGRPTKREYYPDEPELEYRAPA